MASSATHEHDYFTIIHFISPLERFKNTDRRFIIIFFSTMTLYSNKTVVSNSSHHVKDNFWVAFDRDVLVYGEMDTHPSSH